MRFYPWIADYMDAFRQANGFGCTIQRKGSRYCIIRDDEGDRFRGTYTSKQIREMTKTLYQKTQVDL